MQTLIRLSAVLAIALALANCQVGSGFTSSRAAPVLGGALQIGVPPSYCIDGKASRESRDTAVILMGRCSDAMKAIPALITVSIGQGGSAGVMTAGGQALAAFFASQQGRATLARSGRAGDVKIIAALSAGDAFLLHLQDRNVGEYWRAVIGVKARLVTLSATGTDEVRLDPVEGRKILEKALDALRTANKAPV
ncbi:hypothetical protein [Cypionkella sp.]|uniref:hypothetical protein n=1 Tax=Cypionkella sp. TaxID=2811411 RepID=UPI002722F745|nr:hypothetical protein [Cypionkella sp.]MDO8985060.1 hypothetical protein [Cypionkella sp.]MDP2047383.1 hypothetical protein [Cypionkella sp.]